MVSGPLDATVQPAFDTDTSPSSRLFEQTLRELDGVLRRFLQGRLGNGDLAADAAQETYLRMLRYRNLTHPGEIRALLFRVADSVLTDQHRRARSRQAKGHCAIDDLEVPSTEPAPERVVAGRQELEVIKQAIRGLSPRCREVFILHRFESMTYKEIAKLFGTSERTVENQVAKAMVACRAALKDRSR